MRRALFAVLGLCLIHCGKSTAGGTGSTSGAAGTTSSGATTSSGSTGAAGTSGGTIGSGGTSGGASTTSSGSGGSSGSYHGAVFFTLIDAPAPIGTSHTITAGFVDQNSPIPNDPADCTGGEQVGSCCYRNPGRNASGSASGSTTGASGSTSSGGSSGAGGSSGGRPAAYSAGVITLSDGSSSLGTLMPGMNGAYPLDNSQTWSQGDALSASAAGDVVHAFSGTVTAPPPVAVTSPMGSPPLGLAQVSTSQALVVTWNGSGGTKVYTVLGTLSLTQGELITCTSADDGHVTVPSSLLAHFSSQGYGLLGVFRAVETDASTDNAQVTIYASSANGLGVQYTP
jgi:hypothetical protein